MAKQSLDIGVQVVKFKISNHLTIESPKFSGGPGEAYLKVIEMVTYLNEKMGLLAKYNGYQMEKQNTQQDQALLDFKETSKMPMEGGQVLKATEQASGDKHDKPPLHAKVTTSFGNKEG